MIGCSVCGVDNPEHYRFCLNCGAELSVAIEAGATAAPLVDATPGPIPLTDGQRKQPSGASSPASADVTTALALARLVLIRPDRSEGGSHTVYDGESVIGRQTGALFRGDPYLSPRHAILRREGGQLLIEDVASLNGVYVRIDQPEPLDSRDVFRIGQELLRLDMIEAPVPLADGTEVFGSPNPGYWGRLSLMVKRDIDGSAFPLIEDEVFLGREQGDIVFSDDGYVSGSHAKLVRGPDGSVFLVDLGSSNGTFIRLRRPRFLRFGTEVILGQQLFRLDDPNT